MMLSTQQLRCEMKSYNELKAEVETIQQQMAEAKKSDRTDALKKFKELCKEFGFTAWMLKGSLAEGRKSK
ncbi:H-NS histone family protein [Candidatus Thioglobus sp.]|nr:H-NS histone family protein [Candidatus Thioglobus sp.]